MLHQIYSFLVSCASSIHTHTHTIQVNLVFLLGFLHLFFCIFLLVDQRVVEKFIRKSKLIFKVRKRAMSCYRCALLFKIHISRESGERAVKQDAVAQTQIRTSLTFCKAANFRDFVLVLIFVQLYILVPVLKTSFYIDQPCSASFPSQPPTQLSFLSFPLAS